MTTMLYLLWLLQSMFSVVAIGVTALTARFTGAQDLPSAVRATNQAMLLGLVMADWHDHRSAGSGATP